MNQQNLKKNKLSYQLLFSKGYKEFYKGIKPTIIHSCILYYPTISYLSNYWNKNHQNLKYKLSNDISKSVFISLFITPPIMTFESIKTEQQLNKLNDRRIHLFKGDADQDRPNIILKD